MEQKHNKLVNKISKQVQSFYKQSIPFRIYHGSTNSTRKITFESDKMVDVSKLNRVLSIDTKSKTAIVEPNVPMDQLVKETLKKGLIPPVVMEFPGITVGGGIQGGAGESSSYKFGTFNRITNWYDIILGDGSTLRVSPKKHSNLYWGAAGSYGSLGIITAAELQLIPAKKYIVLEYIPVHSFSKAVSVIKAAIKQKPDYIDGIMFSKNLGVIMVGRLNDNSRLPKHRFTRPHDEWFYLHAEKNAKQGKIIKVKIPITDYFFRYDRGGFWVGSLAYKRFKTPFNRFTRFVLNPLMKTRAMYNALQASGAGQEYIIQDIALPENSTVKFMQYIDKKFGIYPLWLCPLLPDNKSPLLSSYLNTNLVINVGVWGDFHGSYEEFIAANRDLEFKVAELRGKKWLYAHMYYDEKTFWKIYGGKDNYVKLRKKYKAEKLLTVYDKVKVTKREGVNKRKGVLITMLGMNGLKKINYR